MARPQGAYVEHAPVKPEKLVNTYIGLIERQTKISQVFARKGIDQFKGSEGDAVTIKVPGRLAARRYKFRNDRTNPIKFDRFAEYKVTTTFGDLIYQGVEITDEQRDFDLLSPQSIVPAQARAVGKELEAMCLDTLLNADFEVIIGTPEAELRQALIEARRVLNRFEVDGARYLFVGDDFEAALLDDEKLNLAQNVGEDLAKSSFENAILGRRYGFTIVQDNTLPADAALAVVGNPAVLLTGAPSIPFSKRANGATTSYEGLALRWMQDYDDDYRVDRSVVDTYVGTELVKDRYAVWDNAPRTDDLASPDQTHKGEMVGTADHFVRAIKLELGGTDSYPTAASTLAADTGVSESNKWFVDHAA